jgi:Divergent InlB B-repeat domain
MLRSLAATALLGLVLVAGASASSKSLVYLTVQVGSFDSAVTVDPPSPEPPVCSATDCRFAYEQGTEVTLKALGTSLSPFIKWSGACSSSGSSPVCSGRLVGDTRVRASFSRLTVHYNAGKGGHVERDPRRGSCGDGCDVFGYHDSVVLRAIPDRGYHVDHWSGACEDGRAWQKCTISNLAWNISVYVSFARDDGLGETTQPVGYGSLAKVSVSGQGTVRGQVAAEDFRCGTGSPCKIYPNKGSAVAVTATAVTGWKLDRWTGRCAGRSSVCIFMNQPWPSSPVPTVQAAFVPA